MHAERLACFPVTKNRREGQTRPNSDCCKKGRAKPNAPELLASSVRNGLLKVEDRKE
jgi:hypothetical protein